MVDPHCAHISKEGGGLQAAARITSAESMRRHWFSLRGGAALLLPQMMTTFLVIVLNIQTTPLN